MNAVAIVVLVGQCRSGSANAQTELWGCVSEPLCAWIRGKFAGLQEPDVRAIACEAFAEAILKLAKFEGKSSFVTWLFSIAGNLARQYLDRESRHDADVALDSAPEIAFRRRVRRPEEQTFDELLRDLLRAAHLVLTPDQELVVVWKLLRKLDRTEIARRLGKTVAAVDMLQQRAMERLRRVCRMQLEGHSLLSRWTDESE